jgi:hypothetical protein
LHASRLLEVGKHQDVEQFGRTAEGITQKRRNPQKMEEPPGEEVGLGGSCSRPFSGEETQDGSAWTLNRFRQSESMPR